MEDKILVLKDIKKYYTGAQAVVMGLAGVDLSFSRGEFVAITGESGSGKSTLAHVLGGILPYENGEMYFRGSPTSHFDSLDWERYRRDNISFISQNYGILPGATVQKNVISALLLSGMGKREAKGAAEKILRQVELWELRRRRAAKLSSGQKQRLSIARALAKPAPILIADEPTGNLDAENSAKIIELLAQAAKDRLVILVTHEFPEAEDLATRHIVLRDGLVVTDTALRPANEPGAIRTPQRKKRSLSLYVAGLQTGSRPVWAASVAVFFTLTAFAVFAFLGVFIINLDDTSTYRYDSSAFPNGSTTRIVVGTLDGSPMTQEDYDALLAVKEVSSLEPNGYVSDVQYAYREGVDYRTIVNHQQIGVWYEQHFVTTHYTVNESAPYTQTIPLLSGGREFLKSGRLPENFYEVVAGPGGPSVGQTIHVGFYAPARWSTDNIIWLDFRVVGATGWGKGVYFHESVGRFLMSAMQATQETYCYLPQDSQAADQLEKGTFLCSASEMENLNRIEKVVLTLPVTDPELLAQGTTELTLVAKDRKSPMENSHGLFNSRLLMVDSESFEALTGGLVSEQVSLTISDYAYTDRILEQIQSMGYIAASPYRLGATKQVPELAAERMQTLQICLTALIAVVALQIVLLRALFSVQTESFRILSNIGLTSRTARASVLWQMMLFTLLGQLVGGAAVWMCGCNGVKRIEEMLRYLPLPYVLVLSGVHLVASLLSALLVIRSMEKQVYPLAGKNRDLNLEEGKEENL